MTLKQELEEDDGIIPVDPASCVAHPQHVLNSQRFRFVIAQWASA